jgi:DNA polymerase V
MSTGTISQADAPLFLSSSLSKQPFILGNDIESIARLVPGKSIPLPLYSYKIPAGFRSPAEDHIELSLDLNEYCIQHPAATFMVRVSGHCMTGVGIYDNDILIVDRSLEAVPGKVVIAVVDGELTVKQLLQDKEGQMMLCPANPDYSPIALDPNSEVTIWGVVAHVIRSFK